MGPQDQQHIPVWRPARFEVTRRAAIIGLSTAGLFGPSTGAAQGVCVLTPDSGEGPFYFDPSLVRSDIGEGHEGAPLGLSVDVIAADGCRVLERARVDIWQADGIGLYSGYDRQPGVGEGIVTDVRGQTFLRGTQFTNATGRVDFTTIYPSWYGGRTPHIHFKIFLSEREVIASQIFFPEETNTEVFEGWDPYRQYHARRTGFNQNDMFLTDGVGGVFCTIERNAAGYLARATIAVAGA